MPEPVSVTVDDVKKPEAPKVEEKKEAPKEQYVSVDELKRIEKQMNQVAGALRVSEKSKGQLEKKIEELEGRLSGRNKPEAVDDLDAKLESGDWRTPVETLAEKKVNEILSRRQQEETVRAQEAERLSVLEDSKKQVRERYADIDDPSSEIAQRYMKVLNSKPKFLRNEFGPVLAMREMEDELRQEGRLDEFTKKVVDKEVERRARASGASLRPGSPAKSETTVLSKEQKEFCKQHGVAEEAYLKTLKSISNRSSETED